MFDIYFLIISGLIGGTIALIGFIVIIGRRISEPKEALKQKVDRLEKEVYALKKRK